MNNKVANYLAEYLKGYATTFRVDDTTGKTDVKLTTRRNTAINKGANLLISIHHNAFTGKWNNATGTEVFRHSLYAHKDTKKLAKRMSELISKETGLKNRGSKTALFTVIATSKIPCLLCEGGFMDGNYDYKLILSDIGQRAYAKGVADAIIEYYNLKKETVENKPKTSQYTKGLYKTLYNMKVRTGAGTNYRAKKKSELTKDGQKNATITGCYKKGTIFTAQNIINNSDGSVWAKSPSGYICIKDKKQVYCKKV